MGRIFVNAIEFLLAGITLHFMLPMAIDFWDYQVNLSGNEIFQKLRKRVTVARSVQARSTPIALPDSGKAREVIRSAVKYLDVPYVWGGKNYSGVDCSGLMFAAFGDIGIHLQRSAERQFTIGAFVRSMDELVAGDLIFFQESWAAKPTHVGLCIGGKKMIHASSKLQRVVIRNYDINYYRRRFIGGRRILGR